MVVHFVCVGNSYRSRLAEAYLNSKNIPQAKALSSGIHADKNENGPISWYAAWLLKRNNLIPYMSPTWTKTTTTLLNESDLIIFMDKNICAYVKSSLHYTKDNYQTWNILDLPPRLVHYETSEKKVRMIEEEGMKIANETFHFIKHNIEKFIIPQLLKYNIHSK